MDQRNEKIIKNFMSGDTIVRRTLHAFIKAMCAEARGGEIEAMLWHRGMTPCGAREWGKEHIRRDKMLQRNLQRKYRKDTSAFGRRGQNDRRSIASSIVDGRRLEFHATKGTRSYRVPA